MFDEDPELLRAALDIIEQWEVEAPYVELTEAEEEQRENAEEKEEKEEDVTHEGASSGTENDSGDDIEDCVANIDENAACRRPLSTHVRRRDEINFLREKLKEMGEQLEQLHAEASAASASDSSPLVTEMWRGMAGRQLRMRQCSELDQAKLKEQLAMQTKVAQRLVKLMHKAKRIEDHEDFPRSKKSKIGIEISSSKSTDDQLKQVEGLYRERDAVFKYDKFDERVLKFMDVDVSEHHGDHVILDVREAWAVPFEWPRVLDAVWTYLLKRSQDKACRPDHGATITLDGDVFFYNFSMSGSMASYPGKFDAATVTKRFPSDDASDAAIVTQMISKPQKVKPSSNMLSTHAEEWLRTVPLDTGELGGYLTLMQCRQRFRIYFDIDIAPGSKQQAGMLSQFLLDQVKLDVELRHEVVETLLLNSHH